jgi:alkylation response protein AidB-like acyl-CoA dehydrogenase
VVVDHTEKPDSAKHPFALGPHARWREFAESEVEPLAKQLDETGHFPHETFRKAAALGLTGVTFSRCRRRRA